MRARKENITMRASHEDKLYLQKASEIAGFSNLTNFIMTAARKEANRIISDQATTYVSPADWRLVNDMISHPPEPNTKLKKLMAKRRGA